MEIRDYILDEEEFEKIRRTKARRKKGDIQADYHILFQSGCDFGVEKKAGKRISRLIILVSKGQYYINEGGIIKVLTVPLLKKFLKELADDILLPDVYWIGGLCNDQNMAGRILKTLRSQYSTDMLKKGTIYVYSDHELNRRQNECEDYFDNWFGHDPLNEILVDTAFYNWTVDFLAARRGVSKKQLFQELIGLEVGKKETMLLKSFDAFQYIYDLYGSDWGKKAVEKYMTSSIEDIINRRNMEKLLEVFSPKNNSFELMGGAADPFSAFERKEKLNRKNMARRLPAEKLLDYLMCHSCKEGYAFSMEEFLADWISYLKMQKELYGKIDEKYPEHLKSSLKRVSYEHKLHEEEITRKQWAIAADKMRELEFRDDVYLIKSPRGIEDLANEATHQHNCVLDYAEKVRRGEEQILFMRKCAEEEMPLVTLEVLPGGRVGQIFGAFNMMPSDEEMKFIRKWAKTKKLIMPENPLPPRAANNFMDGDLDGLFDEF